MFKQIRPVFLMAALVAAACLPASALVKSPPEKAILPNGLRVIVVEDRSLPIMAVNLLVNTGWTVSDPQHPGLAMLVEPLLETADTRSATRFDLNARLEKEGGQITYSVGFPGTSIAVQGSSQQLVETLQTLRAVGFELTPNQEQFDQARQVLTRRFKEEKAYPLAAGYLEKQAMARLFPGTRFSQAVWPDPEDLPRFVLADLQRFLAERFVPNNAILVVVGDVDPSAVFKAAMEVFGQLPAATLESLPPQAERPQRDKRKEVREFLDVKTSQAVIAFDAPALEDADMPAAVLWETALGGANNAWLGRLFETEFPEMEHLQVKYRALAGHGVFTIGFESRDPEIDRVISSVLSYLSTVYLDPPRGESLERLEMIKQTRESGFSERRLNLAFQLGTAELAKSYTLAAGLLSSVSRVTPKDMERVAKTLFAENPYVVQVVHPLSCQLRGEPKTRLLNLANGMTVLVKPYASSEVAAASCFIRTGAVGEGRSGHANLLAWMLGELVNSPAEHGRLTHGLDLIGGEVTVEPAPNGIVLSGFAGKGRMRKLLEIIARLLTKPKFGKELVARSQERLAQELEQAAASPGDQLYLAFQNRMFPAAVLPNLYPPPEAVKQLTQADLEAFHRTWTVPGNISCTLVGNFDPDEVASQALAILGAIPGGAKPERPPLAADLQQPLAQTQAMEIPITDPGGSAYLAVGYRLPSVSSSWSRPETKTDFVANLVLFHLLSWSRNGLIQREMVARGLAEELQIMQFTTLGEVGWIFLCVRVPADRLAEARQALQKILDGLPQVAVSQDDIRSAQQTVKFYFARVMERSMDQARFLVSFLGAGLGESFFDEINVLYKDVTIDMVKAAAARNFRHYLLVTGKPR